MTRTTVLLALVACGLVSTATGQTWPDPNAHDVVPYETSGMTHGPCIGAPTENSARIWIRTGTPVPFEVLYDTHLPLGADCQTASGRTDAASDNTGWVQLNGLLPGTRYYYAIRIDGQLADLRLNYHDTWPSFRTLPDVSTCRDPKYNPRGLFNFAFSIGCGASQDPVRSGGQYASPPAFDTILRQFGDEIAFHVMNGDAIYEELRDGTREGIRANYRLYWHRGRSWARLIRNVPVLFMYDDHEVGWDIHGCGEEGLGAGKWLIRDIGTSVWQEYCGWSSYPQSLHGREQFGSATLTAGDPQLRDANADFSALDLTTASTLHVDPYTPMLKDQTPIYRPVKQSNKNAGVYSISRVVDRHTLQLDRPARASGMVPYSIGTHHWYDRQIGNCHLFVLDTRGERTRPNFGDYRDPSRSILGAVQKRWLLDGISRSSADFIFVVSPDPLVVYHTAFHVDPQRGGVPKGDGFSSFVYEREQLITQFDQLHKPVLVFTGDVHASACVRITDNVWEMMCGPMGSTNHPIGTCGGGTMPLGGDWNSQGRSVRVKWVGTFPDNVNYARLRQPYFAVVQVNNVTPSPRPEGTGYQWMAFDAPQVVVRWHDGYSGRLVYAEGISANVRGLAGSSFYRSDFSAFYVSGWRGLAACHSRACRTRCAAPAIVHAYRETNRDSDTAGLGELRHTPLSVE